MSRVRLHIERVDRRFARPFRIAYRARTHAQTVVVRLERDGCVGRGEALGVSYLGETADNIAAELEKHRGDIVSNLSRQQLQLLMPAGGARNALDSALWDLEAKLTGKRIWELCHIAVPQTVTTTLTIGLDDPAVMAALASTSPCSQFKLKLDGNDDVERVRAVRRARPDALLIVDANQAWDEARLLAWAPAMAKLGVQLIEQPLPIGKDDALIRYEGPIHLAADESCQTAGSLPRLRDLYQFVNIKLDKTGGLTEALVLAREAKALGFKLLVGCMGGSSLSMAPAFLLAGQSDFVDLDGPLLLADDIDNGIQYDAGVMSQPPAALWG